MTCKVIFNDEIKIFVNDYNLDKDIFEFCGSYKKTNKNFKRFKEFVKEFVSKDNNKIKVMISGIRGKIFFSESIEVNFDYYADGFVAFQGIVEI